MKMSSVLDGYGLPEDKFNNKHELCHAGLNKEAEQKKKKKMSSGLNLPLWKTIGRTRKG